jgi:CubicO group peptidase (beta-lactamase class C family)
MLETLAGGLDQFDDLVNETMAEWRIPGLAMAVVRRDEPALLRCWGVRDIDSGAPVTPDTCSRSARSPNPSPLAGVGDGEPRVLGA